MKYLSIYVAVALLFIGLVYGGWQIHWFKAISSHSYSMMQDFFPISSTKEQQDFQIPQDKKNHLIHPSINIDDLLSPKKSDALNTKQSILRASNTSRNLRSIKMNIYFDEKDFIARALAANDSLIEDITCLLTHPLEDSPNLELGQKPEEVLNRMAAIDLLEQIAQNDMDEEATTSSIHALTTIVHHPIDKSIQGATKQVMVGEKIDALAALVRIDPIQGVDVFSRINNPKQKEILIHTLHLDLAARGITKQDAENVHLSQKTNETGIITRTLGLFPT